MTEWTVVKEACVLSDKTCIDCKVSLPLAEFNLSGGSHRPECKKCESIRRQSRKTADPYTYRLKAMAHGILSRTKYKLDYSKNRTYKERGVENRLGENIAEIKRILDIHFGEQIRALMENGDVPTVDRIDAFGHYEIENIRIISHRKNVKETGRKVTVTYPDGSTITYKSVSEASRRLGIKRDTIYYGAKHDGANSKGLKFKIG